MSPGATDDWLTLLESEAAKREIPVDTEIAGRIFHFRIETEDPVIGKIRTSSASERNYSDEDGSYYIWQRFNREQERLTENSSERVCSIQLDVRNRDEYDEDKDHFLFIPGELILHETYSEGDQKITIRDTGNYEGSLARYVDDWDALFAYATGDLSFEDINDDRIQTNLDELVDDETEAPRNDDPTVWIEKTELEGREYKQEGQLKLGRAVISPSMGAKGADIYKEVPEAEPGDIVLHLLQNRGEFVGVSTVKSELEEGWMEHPEYDSWSELQQEAGGYRRWLTGYQEFDEPVHVYDDILQNETHQRSLMLIREEYSRLIYDKNLSLLEGFYFTRCPDEMVTIIAGEQGNELSEYLRNRNYELQPIEPPTTDEYTSLEDARSDIGLRYDRSQLESDWLEGEFIATVIEEWTEALTNFDFQQSVSPGRGAKLDQIRNLYTANLERFEEEAEQLGVGSLHDLNPSQTLFAALLRDLQERHASKGNVNHVKMKTVLVDGYEIEDRGEIPEPDVSHELIDYLISNQGDVVVHRFAAPPDYWITSIQRGALSIEEDRIHRSEQISPGDIFFIHSNRTLSENSPQYDLGENYNGIIGAGILGGTFEKDELWWLDEVEGRGGSETEEFPLVYKFDRVYLTSDSIDRQLFGTDFLQQGEEIQERNLRVLTEGALGTSEVNSICERVSDRGYPSQGDWVRFLTEGGDEPEYSRPVGILEALAPQLTEVPTVNIWASLGEGLQFPREDMLSGLHFEDGHGDRIITQVETALASGKHIIFTGPPGTGKTEIAERVSAALVDKYPDLYSGAKITTATADWSTFDTVGGYMPSLDEQERDDLEFSPGILLHRFRSSATRAPINEPIVIDELNRADIDKAFGQLFTVLSGQSVELPYTIDDNEVQVVNADGLEDMPASHQFVVPESWQILATMNTYDKTSLYEMSYAFMRRFAFIPVEPPDLDQHENVGELVATYASEWGLTITDTQLLDAVGEVWTATNTAVGGREIGPAIVEDILDYAHRHPSSLPDGLTEGIIAYILPQLEGVRGREPIVRALLDVDDVDSDMLRETATDLLEIDLEDDGR